MSEYKGSIELISGLIQKNKVDFPLVEAHAVAVYEEQEDATVKEVRLDEKLKQLAEASDLSDDIKTEIVETAKTEVFKDPQFTGVRADATANSNDIVTIKQDIADIENDLENFQGDNDQLKITYNEEQSILYLHTGDEVDTDPDTGNVISQTTVTGGGGGTTAGYNLVLKVTDVNTSFSVLKGAPAVINFDAVLTSNEDKDTPITEEDITLYLYVDNVLRKTVKQRAGVGSMDVTEFIKVGPNSIKLTASYVQVIESTGEEIPINSTKRWSIEVVEMYLTSNFSDTTVKYETFTIPYVPYGNLSKTITLNVGDKKPYKTEITSLSGRTLSFDVNAYDLTHGSYPIELWASGVVGNETIESEHLYFDVMFAEVGNNTPIIRAIVGTSNRQQYDNIPIKYSVHREDSLTSPVTISVDGVVTSSVTVDRSEQTFIYKPTDFGSKIITFQCGNTVKEIELEITKFPYEISPVTANLDLDFSPVGRSNQDDDYNIFKNNVVGKEDTIDWTLSDNFDWVNGGWKVDEEGNSYFCIKAGTTVDINYKLFNDKNTVVGENKAQGNGKEFKLIFKTTNVAKADATWLKCMALPEIGSKEVGLQMDMHTGYVNSSSNTLAIPYSEDDVIEFDMNIIPSSYKADGSIDLSTKDIGMIMTYEDGTPVQPLVFGDGAASISFKQANAVPISIGSPYCDVHIYRMKAYNRFLSDSDILNNFIADARTSTEMVDRFTRNQIYDPNQHKLTPEYLAKVCPWLRIIKLEVPRFTYDKGDKVSGSRIEMIYGDGTNAELDKYNWYAIDAVHNGQGTSSNEYGYAGRNLELNLKWKTGDTEKDTKNQYAKVFVKKGSIYEEQKRKAKVQLGPDSAATNYFNIKVNIASSENANNALLQKRYETYLPYLLASQNRDPLLKSTMNFYNCVIFVKETGIGWNYDPKTGERLGEKVEAPQEFTDNEYHFYAIGNIGDSKKTDDSRASDPDDPNEFCIEIMDWNRDLSSFPKETIVLANKGGQNEDKSWKYDGMVKDSNLSFLLEKKEGGSIKGQYEYTQDTTVDMTKDYYVDILEHDDFSEDYTYGWRYSYDDEDSSITSMCYARWKDFYKFITKDVTTETEIKAWKEEFADWFNTDAAFYYYLFTLRYTMVDNRAKNSFWHFGKARGYHAIKNPIASMLPLYSELIGDEYVLTTDEDIDSSKTYYTNYQFDFWDYDNDTALGIDNAGKLEMSYGVEDKDTDEAGATYFRAADSLFFTRLANYFSNELEDYYRLTLEASNSNVFSSTSLINQFDEWQSEFPEELWRLDYERKYKRTYCGYNGGGYGPEWDNAINPKATSPEKNVNARFLTEMMNGKKKYQRRQFERNQDTYMSSKFEGSANFGSTIELRGAGNLSGSDYVYPQNTTITVTPYLNMYINLYYSTDSRYYHQRCTAGVPVTVPYPKDQFDFIYVRGASHMQSLGDLSLMYLQTAGLAPGVRLKEIVLGNPLEGYENKNFQTLNISGNNRLLETLDIRNLPTLEGNIPIAAIPSLRSLHAEGTNYTSVTFADSGLLEEAYLPASMNTVIANNMYFLETLYLEDYNNLAKLVIDNCPKIKSYDIAVISPNLKIVRITDINWEMNDTSLLNRILACRGVGEDGSTEISQSVLTGKVWVKSIRQAELDAYALAWPELEVEYDTIVPQQNLIFRNEGAEIYRYLVDRGTTLTAEYDPVANGTISIPTKPDSANGQYTYNFSNWQTINGSNFIGTTVLDSDITFDAVYSETIKKYKVTWYSDDSRTKVILQESEVAWGTNGEYVGATPTKGVEANNYSLFAGWDKSSSNITADREIYPVWSISNPTTLGNVPTTSLTAADIMGLKDTKRLSNYFVSDGLTINIPTGYFPTYENIEEKELISEATPLTGTEVIRTGERLFAEDKSFTLLLDYSFEYNGTSPQAIASCFLNNNNGFTINAATLNDFIPTLYFKNTNGKNASVGYNKIESGKQYREICVIRKVKGDNGLYIYKNNRFSINPIEKVYLFDTDTFNAIQSELVFGGLLNSVGDADNLAKGMIYYSKLWRDDIGDDECFKVCSWINESLEFEFVGANRYYYMNSDIKTQASFIATKLLDGLVAFNEKKPTGQTSSNTYATSCIRQWLQEKPFKGLSIEWQQIIPKVNVSAFKGQEDSGNYSNITGDLVTSHDNLYLPAAAELSSEYVSTAINNTSSIRYGIEIDPATANYSTFAMQANRIKYMSNNLTTPKGYWTRSPKGTQKNWMIGVNGGTGEGSSQKPGSIGDWNDWDENGSAINWTTTGSNSKFGVLFGFSI